MQQQFADEDMMIFQLVFVFFYSFFVFVFVFGFGLGAEVNNSCNSSLQMMITPSLENHQKLSKVNILHLGVFYISNLKLTTVSVPDVLRSTD